MMKQMYKITLAMLMVLAFSAGAIAQAVYVPKDIQGRRMMTKTNVALKGSPYLYETWANGTVKFMNGATVEGQLMYDQLEDKLVFNNGDGEQQEFIDPVYEFTIQEVKDGAVAGEKTFRKGFPAVDGGTAATFYEILADGKVMLLKRTNKVIVEQVPYGSSTKVQHVKTQETYYIATSVELIKMKSSKKAYLDVMANKTPELESFIKENRISFRDDADLAKLVTYYNTL